MPNLKQSMVNRIIYIPAHTETFSDAMQSFYTDLQNMNSYIDSHCYLTNQNGTQEVHRRIEISLSATQDAAMLDLLPQLASALGKDHIKTHGGNVMEGHN